MEPLENLEHAFKSAKKGLGCALNQMPETIYLEIPMFANSQGLMPLDYSCGIYEHVIPKKLSRPKTMSRKFKPLLESDKTQVSQSENAQLTKSVFAGMADYQFMHTSHRIH